MGAPPRKEFGKRRPQPPAPVEPAPKRSAHVALLLMGTFAVGGAAYALMPRETCTPPATAAGQTATPQINGANCTSGGSSGGHGGGSSGGSGHSSRYGFFGGSDSSGRSSSGASSSEAESGSVSRGGFGSFARAFGFSGRG